MLLGLYSETGLEKWVHFAADLKAIHSEPRPFHNS